MGSAGNFFGFLAIVLGVVAGFMFGGAFGATLMWKGITLAAGVVSAGLGLVL